MNTKLSFLMVLALLFGLVLASPAQTVLAASAVATFTFTSSPNPSASGQLVTFTVSATGTDATYQPFGYVKIYDNGNLIYDCRLVSLNYLGSIPTPDHPAVCTTRFTTPGVHTITAYFSSLLPSIYDHANLTLVGGQTVTDPYPLTISPETLPDGVYGGLFQQQLSAACSEGVQCEAIYWSSYGVPEWMGLEMDTGIFQGSLQAAGEFSFTVVADDYSGSLGSRTYTWTVLKATPEVTIGRTFVSDGMMSLWALVDHPNHIWNPRPAGAVSFSVDGVPVEGCSGANAIQVFVAGAYANCYTGAPAGLQAGSHSVQADFTPDSSSAANYNSASGTGTLFVNGRVNGWLFDDLDRDGVRDTGEGPVNPSFLVGQDQSCDGTSEYTTYSMDITGQFSFETAIPDATYCLNVATYGNWRQSTMLQPFTVADEITFEIGLYDTHLTFSPETLPDASVGEAYVQTIYIDGGTPPYTLTSVDGILPEGLSFDEETLTLSGTPTAVGSGGLFINVQDADGITAGWISQITVLADGNFTLASDPNPSAPGQEVTLTFTGSGDVVIPENGPDPVSPFGQVAFYDGDTAITGCEAVLLNYDPNLGIVDQPAVCSISALDEGSHAIRADFTSFAFYRNASLTLNQQVEVSNTPPVANPGGPYLAAINTPLSFDGSLSSDPDGDSLTYAWDFGDGGTSTEAMPSHSYTTAGIYPVCLIVNDGTEDSAPVCIWAVLFDPSAGFVTGSGWIDSPAGAYLEDPSLTGQATFGFVSKYRKGATVPQGTTEFQFQAGTFSFTSIAYEWLVVNRTGNTAQFKGSGLVNGAADPNGNAFKFQVWAGDGSPDTFRIRIWWEAGGVETVVYDNGVDQSIGAGNIIVHVSK